MKTIIAVLATSILLGACKTAPEASPVAPQPAVVTKNSVDIDPQLIQDCPTLPTFEERQYSKEEVLNQWKTFLGSYSTCWHDHHDLVTVVKRAFNIDSK